MKIIILGGVGFLGINLVYRCLEDADNQVTVLDSLDPRFKSDIHNLDRVKSKISFIKADICDSRTMNKVVQDKDVIFNCAAQTSHPLSLIDPILDAKINCIGNLTVLESIRKHNPKVKIIFTASSTSIGKARFINVDEGHVERPLDIYSANKGVAEKYYFIYHKVYGLKTLSLRFANLFGPYGKGLPDFGFINYFIYQALHHKEIPIYGSGSQMRNVMYVKDAVDLLYKAIYYDNLFGEIYFAVHREHYSVRSIAKAIIEVFGKGVIKKIPWPEMRKKIEINDIIINGEKLFLDTKWKPKYSLKQGLIETKKIIESLSALT